MPVRIMIVLLMSSTSVLAQEAAPAPAPMAAQAPASAPVPAPAPPAAPVPAAATPLPSDRRERIIAVCMNEAKAKGAAAGVQDVTLKYVQDTDLTSGGNATMRAKVQLVSVDTKGKTKKKSGTFSCATRDDVVTRFEFDD